MLVAMFNRLSCKLKKTEVIIGLIVSLLSVSGFKALRVQCSLVCDLAGREGVRGILHGRIKPAQ
jgi:uncharacterized membrane protein (DUF441 family)